MLRTRLKAERLGLVPEGEIYKDPSILMDRFGYKIIALLGMSLPLVLLTFPTCMPSYIRQEVANRGPGKVTRGHRPSALGARSGGRFSSSTWNIWTSWEQTEMKL